MAKLTILGAVLAFVGAAGVFWGGGIRGGGGMVSNFSASSSDGLHEQRHAV